MTASLFAIAAGSSDSQPLRNPFAGTTAITLERRSGAPLLAVYAADPSRIATWYDESTDSALYLWGRAAHPTVSSGEPLLRWVAGVVHENRTIELRELHGPFVVLIDDRKHRQIRFITDPLGIRPWLVGSHGGKLVLGSHVLEICRAGLSGGKPDYDALACWLRYNIDFTAGSIVEDYRHAAPGTISTYDPSGRLIERVGYAPFEYDEKCVERDQMLDDLHDIVSHSYETLTREASEINLPLSGGFDSRLICAMVSRNGHREQTHLATVHNADHEIIPARKVTEALGLPLEIIPAAGRHILDLFDDPFAYGSGGFPNGRNLACAVARRRPGMPLLSGFIGDLLMRVAMSKAGNEYFDKDSQNLSADALTAAAHEHYGFLLHRLDLCRGNLSQRADERARQLMKRAVEAGMAKGKPLMHVELYNRQRFYFANIFLQHLDAAEAMAPYYNWALINYRTRHARSCFYPDNYPQLFRRFVPQIAEIPHSSHFRDLAKASGKMPPDAAPRHLRTWSIDLLDAFVPPASTSSAIDRKKLLLRLPRGLLRESRCQNELMFLYKLHAFERTLGECGVKVDWEKV